MHVRVTLECSGAFDDSDTATITVTSDCSLPSIPSVSGDDRVPRGGSVTLSVLTSEGSTYQWYRDGEPMDGATSTTLVTGAIFELTRFTVIVTNECGSAQSGPFEVTPVRRRRAVRR